MARAPVLARGAAAAPLAASPRFSCPATPPPTPPPAACTLQFASLFESDDEGDEPLREAWAPQTPLRRGGAGGVAPLPPPPLCVRGAGGQPAFAGAGANAASASAMPGAASSQALAGAARVAQLSAPSGPAEATLARLAAESVAQAGAAQVSSARQLAAHVAAALRRSGVATASAFCGDVARGASCRRTSPPACAHMRSLLDRAGRHAYVTVIAHEPNGCAPRLLGAEALIVEPRLREQFEIPRPSAEYAACLDALPAVFVGTPRRLAALVAWMAARLRFAFAAEDMHVPPWRSARAMLAMWQLDTPAGLAAVAAAEDDVAAMLAVGAAAACGGVGATMHMQRSGVPFPVHVSACTPPAAAARWRGRPGAA